MRALRRLLKRATSWTSKERDEDRLRAEIQEHIALQTEENLREGMSPIEARRRAMLKFGGVEGMKEEFRDAKGIPFLETLLQDTKHAIRRLRKAPVFTAAVILTLALGIGATTSIFTLVHAVLLKSLPVANPSDLYRFGKKTHCCMWGGYTQDEEYSIFSDDLYKHFRDNSKSFAELAAFQAGESLYAIRRANTHEMVKSTLGEFVSGNYFTMFGVNTFIGRTLVSSDDTRSAPPVTVMSYRLWQQRYGSAPSVVGSVFEINGNPFTVVGITPPGFYGDTLRDSPPDLFVPLTFEPQLQRESTLLDLKDANWLDIIGRVRPGVTQVSAEAEARVLLRQWQELHAGDMDANGRAVIAKQGFFLSAGGSGITSMREQYERWLQILMAASGFVLMIVCANVANLMLVRGIERRQQISLSIALGAQTSRLIKQALTESVLLSLCGGAAGLAIAFVGTRLILHFAFTTVPGFASVPISPTPSIPILLFAFGVSLLTGIAFGSAPAWMASRVDPIEALRGVNRSTSRTGSLPRRTLVVLQAALSLVLLSVSGLLTMALRNLEKQDFGFEQDHRTIANIDAQLAGYNAEELNGLYRRLHNSLMGVPGVVQVSFCSYSPQSGDSWNDGVFVEGHPAPGPDDDHGSSFDRVTGGYLESIGNSILRGRGISDRDTDNTTHVAVVNEAFVKKFFPKEDPLGRHFGRSQLGTEHQYEIIGVVKDARFLTYNLEKPVGAFFFISEAQRDVFPKEEFTKGDARSHFLNEAVIVTAPGAVLTESEIRNAFASVNPDLPVNFVRSLREQVALVFTQQRLIAQLTSMFGILSLVLASIGLYGVTAHNALSRTNEIGVRMALGADRGNIVSLVLRGSFGLVLLGLVIGVPLTIGAGRLLVTELYGLSPYNLAVTSVAIATLAFAAFVAALIPALRASYTSPLVALRAE
jgi:predicted permease